MSAPQLHILDLQSGLNYLAGVTLTNPLAAEQQLMHFIDALLAAPVSYTHLTLPTSDLV